MTGESRADRPALPPPVPPQVPASLAYPAPATGSPSHPSEGAQSVGARPALERFARPRPDVAPNPNGPTTPTPAAPSSRIAGLNPVAKLAAALLIALPLVLTIDPVSAAVALVLEIPLLAMAGLTWRRFWLRTAPIWIAAPLSAVTVALYGAPGGEIIFEWFVVRISEGSLLLALSTLLRVLAIGLPAVVLFVTVDPTDLADGLAQIVRLPARFVLGALAGMRLLGLLTDDWRALALARRARGIADTGRLRRVLGMAFALFVLAIRRGSALATAMEARGFGAPGRRTWARSSRLRRGDVLLMLAGAAISATAITVAVLTGAWNFIGGR